MAYKVMQGRDGMVTTPDVLGGSAGFSQSSMNLEDCHSNNTSVGPRRILERPKNNTRKGAHPIPPVRKWRAAQFGMRQGGILAGVW